MLAYDGFPVPCLPHASDMPSAHLVSVVCMIGVSGAKKVELHIVGLIGQDLLLERQTYVKLLMLVLSMIRRQQSSR